MNNIRQIITERLENAKMVYRNASEILELKGQIEAYQDCLNLIDEYTPKIVTKQLSVKEIETLLQDLNKPHQFIIDKPAHRTEADILKDFEKLGWKVVDGYVNFTLKKNVLEKKEFFDYNWHCYISIDKENKTYNAKKICNFTTNGYDLTMQEHKLLNELFTLFGGVVIDDK